MMGSEFVVEGKACGAEVIEGYKLVLVVDSASWWGGCTPFKAKVLELYNAANASDPKTMQVVIRSGD